MRVLVPGFEHRPGVHCGSTAMADALRTVGVDLSEPMAFGLGAGPYFVMLEGPGLSPSTMFFGRSIGFEQELCQRVGVQMEERPAPTFDQAWPELRAMLLEGRPVLLVTDIKFLPHYATSTHFNGHRVLLVGMDESAGVVFVADTHFPGLCEVPLPLLAQSMESDAPPMMSRDCSYATVRRVSSSFDRVQATREAIRAAGHAALEDGGHVGVLGVERLAQAIRQWDGRTDRTWCARFGYQVIEKRGTGGGLFRKLYSAFLQEAAIDDAGLKRLLPLAAAAASKWSALAASLKACSEAAAPDWEGAARLADEVVTAERELWESARTI